MHLPTLNGWPTDFTQAKTLQETLAPQIIRHDAFGPIHHVAGVDVGFEDNGRITRAAVAVLDADTLELQDQAIHREPTRFPYVPGYLSFREVPAIIGALAQVKIEPQLLLCDGQGLAHPRRFGLACHLGLLTDLPSIGVAKSRLIGEHDELPVGKGAHVSLRHKGEIIGAVLRSRSRVRPLYISIGHRIGLDTALDWVMRCTPRYRLPETTRWAHRLASG